MALREVKMPKEGWHAARVTYLIATVARCPAWRLYPSEAGDLWFLVWRYRRQITDLDVVAHADEIVNGALHLAF